MPGLILGCRICCKNPWILPEDKFQNADCINKTDSFQKVQLNKDVFQAESDCWKDFKNDKLNLRQQIYCLQAVYLVEFRLLGKKKQTTIADLCST